MKRKIKTLCNVYFIKLKKKQQLQAVYVFLTNNLMNRHSICITLGFNQILKIEMEELIINTAGFLFYAKIK